VLTRDTMARIDRDGPQQPCICRTVCKILGLTLFSARDRH